MESALVTDSGSKVKGSYKHNLSETIAFSFPRILFYKLVETQRELKPLKK